MFSTSVYERGDDIPYIKYTGRGGFSFFISLVATPDKTFAVVKYKISIPSIVYVALIRYIFKPGVL